MNGKRAVKTRVGWGGGVEVLSHDEEGELRATYKFLSFSRQGRTVWRKWPVSDTVRLDEYGILHAATGRWWFGTDPAGDMWLLVDDAVTKPAPSSWT